MHVLYFIDLKKIKSDRLLPISAIGKLIINVGFIKIEGRHDNTRRSVVLVVFSYSFISWPCEEEWDCTAVFEHFMVAAFVRIRFFYRLGLAG
jgi:hypothetical protein